MKDRLYLDDRVRIEKSARWQFPELVGYIGTVIRNEVLSEWYTVEFSPFIEGGWDIQRKDLVRVVLTENGWEDLE